MSCAYLVINDKKLDSNLLKQIILLIIVIHFIIKPLLLIGRWENTVKQC
jgi:hypothetical protein